MLKLIELTKTFGKRRVVDNVNIEVRKGELYAFLGPNGAGKTTTIKMICGLLKPDHGDVLIDRVSMRENPMKAKHAFGYVPDQPFVYDRLTPVEFLRFVGGLYGLDPLECDEKADYWLDQFELRKYKYELLGSFSYGMRQKVIFTAAFLHNPQVLIIDEPMVGLDPEGAIILKKLLRQRCEAGLAAFVSTHSLEVAEQIADRIGIMYQGKLRAEGTLPELQKITRQGNARLEQVFLELTQAKDMGSIPGEVFIR
ncbi:MAG: ABC transporter ATP-binding protein [bacterium]